MTNDSRVMPKEDVSARPLGRNRMPDNFGCWADTGLCRTHDVKLKRRCALSNCVSDYQEVTKHTAHLTRFKPAKCAACYHNILIINHSLLHTAPPLPKYGMSGHEVETDFKKHNTAIHIRET